jgi:hypothetical protein
MNFHLYAPRYIKSKSSEQSWHCGTVAPIRINLKCCSGLLVSFPHYNHNYISSTTLQGVSESLKTLNDLSTSICALVRHPELEVHKQSDDYDESSGDHAGSNAGHVVRSILSAEDGASDDTTDTSCTDEGSGAESALPLAADVVGLPGEDAGDVGVGSCGSEEYTEVSVEC